MDDDRDQVMNIGELAEKAGISTHTIRYYEKIGILRSIKRSPSGYRKYSKQDLYLLTLALRGKRLGLTLEELKELSDIFWQDPTEKVLTKKSIKTFSAHLDKALQKRKELDAYISLLENEIMRLVDLL